MLLGNKHISICAQDNERRQTALQAPDKPAPPTKQRSVRPHHDRIDPTSTPTPDLMITP